MKMFDDHIFKKGYRPDGWPLCPDCGEDELYITPQQYYVKCYHCSWSEEDSEKMTPPEAQD